jgi:hypothetical protein
MREHFFLHESDRELLAGLGFSGPDNFYHPLTGEIVSEVRDRVVYQLATGSAHPGWFLKIFRHPGGNAPLMQLLQGELPKSQAEWEAERLFWLEQHGFQAPRVAAWGARMKGPWQSVSFILTRTLAGEISLDEWLQKYRQTLITSETISCKRRLLEASAHLLADLHQQGFHHPTPYLRHFFVPDKATFSEPPPITIIDVHTATIQKKVSRRAVIQGLAEWYVSSLRSPLSQTDRLRFIRAYGQGHIDRSLIMGVLARFEQKLHRHPTRYRWAREIVESRLFPPPHSTGIRP